MSDDDADVRAEFDDNYGTLRLEHWFRGRTVLHGRIVRKQKSRNKCLANLPKRLSLLGVKSEPWKRDRAVVRALKRHASHVARIDVRSWVQIVP